MYSNRKRYDKEFKLAAVHLVKENGMSAAKAAKDLGVSQATVSTWVREFEAQGHVAFEQRKIDPKPPSTEEEVRRLHRELARVTMERDILKKAITFFRDEER